MCYYYILIIMSLVEASHVFILEPLLNRAMEAQAVNRVHRLGQLRDTKVHKYVVLDTVEETIYESSILQELHSSSGNSNSSSSNSEGYSSGSSNSSSSNSSSSSMTVARMVDTTSLATGSGCSVLGSYIPAVDDRLRKEEEVQEEEVSSPYRSITVQNRTPNISTATGSTIITPTSGQQIDSTNTSTSGRKRKLHHIKGDQQYLNSLNDIKSLLVFR
jgi:hypothetical protein